jgi:hypothetical protein
MQKSIEWYRKAIKEHNRDSAKFMMLQFGMQGGLVPPDECNKYKWQLEESGFFESPQGVFCLNAMAKAMGRVPLDPIE